ncbi:MAG TPA: Ig-like domain-containing protein, partial [Allosphingosinicella sp.]
MALSLTITRNTSLFNDVDGDGQYDPGDTVLTKILISHAAASDVDALGLSVTATMNGMTPTGLVKITPIAVNDSYGLTGNTPITFAANQGVLANDLDPGGNPTTLTVGTVNGSAINVGPINVTNGNVVTGTVSMSANGSFTFTPATGFTGITSFDYVAKDESGLNSVTTGTVTLTVTGLVWYVDATGAAGGDGSYLKPFTSFAGLNGAGGLGDVDGANNTIFVHNGTYTSGIQLETGQTLYGDGQAFEVNGLQIGDSTDNSLISMGGTGILLATNNTIKGIDVTGTAGTAIGIADNNGTVGNLVIEDVAIGGQGQIIDIDQGGTLNVTLNSAASAGSTGANGGVIDLSFVGGSFTVSGATSISGIHGQTGIDLTSNVSLTSTFTGATTVNTGAQQAINLGANQTSATRFNGNLDVDTTTAAGLTTVGGNTIVINGGTNSINTTTGQILNMSGTGLGTGGVTFNVLGSSGIVANATAISLNNVSGVGAFNGGAVTISGTSGATSDGINITGSSVTSTFGVTSMGSTGAEGVELSGANGAVTFSSLTMNGQAGSGLLISNATNSVTVSAGNLGTTTSAIGDQVQITGGTGAVTIAANVSKAGVTNNVVEINNHTGGAISFSGTINASGGADNGILITGSTAGNITFSGTSKTFNTSANDAVKINGTGAANVLFSNGNLDIDTGAGTGINATNASATLSITGSVNTINTTTGRIIVLDGTDSGGIELQSVGANGGTNTPIFLNNAGNGGFTITGIGTNAGSAGTISAIGGTDVGAIVGAATQGAGVYLNNVGNVVLQNMNFTGAFANFGIRGDNVTNFTLRDSNLTGTFGQVGEGNNYDEAAIRFGSQNGNPGAQSGLKGVGLFEGNNIGGGIEDNLAIYVNGTDVLNLTIKDSATKAAVFNHTQGILPNGTGNDNIHIESSGTSSLTLTVDGILVNGARGDLLQVVAADSTTHNVTVKNSQFHNTVTGTIGGGVYIGGGGQAANYNATVNVLNNTIKGAHGTSLSLTYLGESATINAAVKGNTIGTPGSGYQTGASGGGDSNGDGIQITLDKFNGNGAMKGAFLVEGNIVRDVSGMGIGIYANNLGGSNGSNRLEATIRGNTVSEAGPASATALRTLVAAAIGDNSRMGLSITNNTFDASGSSNTLNAVVIDQGGGNTTGGYYFPGYAITATSVRGESRTGGTASADLATFLKAGGAGVANTLINGPFPNFTGGVDAQYTFGI